MPTQFPNANIRGIFSDAWAPGALGFQSALKYWQGLAKTNAAGNGLPQLAQAGAQSPVGAAYQATPYNPSQGSGIAAYGALKGGEVGARSQGRNVQNQVQQQDIQGATSTASAYGDSLINHIQGIISQNAAESAANAQTVQGIMGMVQEAGNVGADIASGGATGLGSPSLGGGGMGGSAGATGPFSMPSGNMSTFPGMTNATPNTFAQGSLPPWLDPNLIAQYSAMAS